MDFYLPQGRWTHLLNNDVAEGSRWHRQQHGFDSLPLYVRPNTLLALGSNDQKPDYDYSEKPQFHLFELEEGVIAESQITDLQGNVVFTLKVQRTGNTLTLNSEGKATDWTLCLRNIHQVEHCDLASASDTAQGMMITPEHGNRQFVITL